MGGKGRICCAVLTTLWSCNFIGNDSPAKLQEVIISISTLDGHTKAYDPDDVLLSDVTIMIFDENGFLEEKIHIDDNEVAGTARAGTVLLTGKTYSIYACANIGYTPEVKSIDELLEMKCHIAYPDDYRKGIPMSGKIEDIMITEDSDEISLPLERAMAKISLCIDRGGISDDIEMNVTSARIGNCPRSAFLFKESKVEYADECFPLGFHRSEDECLILNRSINGDMSGQMTLYMLENQQEETSFGSFLEIHLDYDSPTRHTIDKPLIYRVFIGEKEGEANVERNSHYRITVLPEDDGLSAEGWKIDKSGIYEKDNGTFFSMSPSGYIKGNIGDMIHIRCDYKPIYAEFDIGLEELEEDRMRGLYDYDIDPDGHGVSLTLKSPGTGIVYMSAGEPVNEADMLIIEINDNNNSQS